MSVSFDDSLAAFACALKRAGRDASADAGVIVRDTRGRLSFVSEKGLSPSEPAHVSAQINDDLRPYISPIGPIADQSAPGANRVLLDSEVVTLRIGSAPLNESITIRLLDRRAIGADWLHAPTEEPITTPPRLVFASLKGGVGRSTALAVLAANLAESGHAVLVVDLDMEAPGIGPMLLEMDAIPVFGSIDFFVESGLKELDDAFMRDSIAASWLGGGRGRVDVMPALGAKSLNNPSEVLAKLARAYLDSPGPDGDQRTFLSQAQFLLERLTGLSRYDAVLVDARAGLHETTAAPILGLGADVLLFGVDQRQTIVGMEILLSHLRRFPVVTPEYDWRYRLRMVQAKAVPDEGSLTTYRAHMFDLFDNIFYDREAALASDVLERFWFGIDDIDGPHFPIPVFDDERYRLFEPGRNRAQLAQDMYTKSFGPFIQFCTERLLLGEDDEL